MVVAREAEAREAEAGEVRAAEPPPCPPSAEGGDARLTRGASVGDVEAEAALEQLAHASREAGAELIRTKQARVWVRVRVRVRDMVMVRVRVGVRVRVRVS